MKSYRPIGSRPQKPILLGICVPICRPPARKLRLAFAVSGRGWYSKAVSRPEYGPAVFLFCAQLYKTMLYRHAALFAEFEERLILCALAGTPMIRSAPFDG